MRESFENVMFFILYSAIEGRLRKTIIFLNCFDLKTDGQHYRVQQSRTFAEMDLLLPLTSH